MQAARCRPQHPAVMPRRPSVLPQPPAILPQHPAVPPRQPSILTPSFLSPGSLLRSASRSFHGIDPACSGEVSRALHGIIPSPSPKPQSPIAGLLRCCRRSLTHLLRDLPRRGGLLIAKTKIPPFLQLFCDCGLPSIPKKRNRTTTQLDRLRFCVSIRNWKVPNNPQSQKSCTASRFFVFEPPGMASGRVWNIPGRQRCGRGVGSALGTPSGRSCGLTMQDGLGRSHEAARPQHCKTKKRGHPTSDALALFSNDVAPTLALTPYSRTQVPSGDRIPRLYA